MNIATEDNCTFCRNEPETIMHLYWSCQISKNFFHQLHIFITHKCNIHLDEWGVKEVIFGLGIKDKVLNQLLLQARYYLYTCKMKNELPLLQIFKKHINILYKIEKYNAYKNFQQTKFEDNWDKYKHLIENSSRT